MRHYLVLLSIIIIIINVTCSQSSKRLSSISTKSEQTKLDKINELQRSILRISNSSYYKNYYYSYPKNPSDTISQNSLLFKENITTNSVAGTGLIIQKDGNKLLLLTCYHLLDFKDTVKTYYVDKEKRPTKHLYSLSIKTGQQLLIFHKNGASSIGTILAFDNINDIALIQATTTDPILYDTPFRGTFGDANKLRLGQEVYVFGFPKGFFMVSKGLVSPSKFKNKFMIDVSFNNGFSGGIACVLNDDNHRYLYVGMANSVAYSSDIVLAPSENIQSYDNNFYEPYTGDIYIKELKMINYGITFVVKSNIILEFLERENIKLNN